ncbi:MAG: hypothetical protein AAF570_26975, partial [Bacteroidota bacterium]
QLQRARSYADIGFPSRYFVRRSYLLNHLYWRFPHPDEMSDYHGYLHQCYASEDVMDLHRAHLDSIADYADSLGIPFAAVVFPFLEDLEGSRFAVDPILSHYRERGIPCLDVGAILAGQKAESLVVNLNDAHPNAYVHTLVADSLYALLQREGYIEAP